jgi:hypothetical protein
MQSNAHASISIGADLFEVKRGVGGISFQQIEVAPRGSFDWFGQMLKLLPETA